MRLNKSNKIFVFIKDSMDWMSSYQNYRIRDLYIPASHDSACYSVNYNPFNKIYDHLTGLYKFLGLLPCITDNFTKTQKYSIYEQLKLGVRFLDLRVCYYDRYYCSHTYLCGTLSSYLDQVKKFAKEHPNELILLRYKPDFPHNDTVNIQDLDQYIKKYLGQLANTQDITYVLNNSISTIISFGNVIVCNGSEQFETYWPNESTLEGFKNSYTNYQNSENANYYGIDCVITPNEKTNFLVDTIYSLSFDIKNFTTSSSMKKIGVYNFDYVDKDLCNLIISKNLTRPLNVR